ncbi:MAG: hypothetical protein J6Q24_02815 [Clostridia bacterium]|nr:hypothetical protein [Clostridia bacterium]
MSRSKAKNANYRRRLVLLYITSFIASLLPLLITFIAKREVYFKNISESVKLAIGGIIAVVLLFIKVVGKLKLPGRISFFAILFIMSYLLESVLNDLALLSGMALLGEVADTLLFSAAIKSTKERLIIEKTAGATTEKIEAVLEKIVGGGRV